MMVLAQDSIQMKSKSQTQTHKDHKIRADLKGGRNQAGDNEEQPSS